MIKLYFLPLSILVKLIDTVWADLSKLAVTLFIMNRALGLGTIAWGAYTVAAFYAGTMMGWQAGMFLSAHGTMLLLELGTTKLMFSMWGLAAAIGAVFVSFAVFAYIGKKLGDSIGPVIPILVGLAIAIGAVYAALTWGASNAFVLTAWAALASAGAGLAMGGVAAWAAPETDDIDLSGYEAQLQGNFTLGETSQSRTSETLYVRKLVYTDSNESELMQTKVATQGGA